MFELNSRLSSASLIVLKILLKCLARLKWVLAYDCYGYYMIALASDGGNTGKQSDLWKDSVLLLFAPEKPEARREKGAGTKVPRFCRASPGLMLGMKCFRMKAK